MRLWLAAYTIAWRELRHFYRDRARIVGVVVQPLLFWLLIGNGLNASFNPGGASSSYLVYFFPGILLMVIMFTAIFSTFSIIEDRREGFLQGVLASPAPRLSIVLGKVSGGAILGALQGALFLLLLGLSVISPKLSLVDLHIGFVGLVELMVWMLVVGAILTSFGVIMAWAMNSTQGYHGVMSVVLLPMWMFSGAAFPIDGTPAWLRVIMQANPLTHGLFLMRGCFTGHELTAGQFGISSAYVLITAAVAVGAASYVVQRGGSQ